LETGNVETGTKDMFGLTPLAGTAMNGHDAVVKLLLEIGNIDANAKDRDGRTPYSWAGRNGDHKVIDVFVAHDTKRNPKLIISWITVLGRVGNETTLQSSFTICDELSQLI
ncbi:hypothetical protein BKA64DRAFT_585172, partial [Cadophora sp. MPI-SDFR-AT-0126]